MPILTTREIIVHLNEGERKLKRTTTKDVDPSIKVVYPKDPVKPVSLSTSSLPDVGLLIDKRRRDEIMAERKLSLQDEKKLVMAKPVAVEIASPTRIEGLIKEASAEKLIAEEKKTEMAERMAKVRAGKKENKK